MGESIAGELEARAISSVATTRGCRTNHSDVRSIDWLWDAPMISARETPN